MYIYTYICIYMYIYRVNFAISCGAASGLEKVFILSD